MGRNAGNRSAAPRKGGTSTWTGVFVGILVGVSMAVGVAWYVMKSPKPFVTREQPAAAKPQPESTKPSTSAATEKPPAKPADDKPRFEFYKVLTDKQNAAAPTKPADKPRPPDKSQLAKPQPGDGKSATFNDSQILQAGSFSNVNDAEKLKAKLALLGVEASIQTATIPDKGVWYRVRLGPYKNADDMNHTRGFLKENGVDSTPMRAQ
jgi:cell division protein FtsN